MPCLRLIPVLVLLTAPFLRAGEKVAVLQTGPQAGHYLTWHGQPMLLIGDSVTQGWMECGTNFNQTAYVDALAARGINLLMLWAFKGTSAGMQQKDKRIGYDAPELWPWAGSPVDTIIRRLLMLSRRMDHHFFGLFFGGTAWAAQRS